MGWHNWNECPASTSIRLVFHQRGMADYDRFDHVDSNIASRFGSYAGVPVVQWIASMTPNRYQFKRS